MSWPAAAAIGGARTLRAWRGLAELAFVAALQYLSPLQRAALILREVLGFSSQETAELLSTTVPAVQSALQRAYAMPPVLTWYQGRQAIAGFLAGWGFRETWLRLPARASGQLAAGGYTLDARRGRWVASALDVLTLSPAGATRMTGSPGPRCSRGSGCLLSCRPDRSGGTRSGLPDWLAGPRQSLPA